jgi:predicted NAD-dependent protein-ADP-ribosyltransferase YbiA (DUF1768 family)
VYQAFKYHGGCTLLSGAAPDTVEKMVNSMRDGGVASSGVAAKRAGSAKAMKQQRCKLDVKKWNAMRDSVMRMAIVARVRVDPLYGARLEVARAGGFVWLHFARGDTYWGGRFNKNGVWTGGNRLGWLMSEVATERLGAGAGAGAGAAS